MGWRRDTRRLRNPLQRSAPGRAMRGTQLGYERMKKRTNGFESVADVSGRVIEGLKIRVRRANEPPSHPSIATPPRGRVRRQAMKE